MALPPGDSYEAIIEEARRRAQKMRDDGLFPADIDERLAADRNLSVTRGIDRAPVDIESPIDSLANDVAVRLDEIEIVGSKPGVAAAQRFAGKFVHSQLNGLAILTEDLRNHVIAALEALAAESSRQAVVADEALATADALAARVAELEREVARLGSRSDERG